MSVSQQYLEYLLDQLGAVRRLSSRRMFGGVGFYADELFFAIASADALYFKVDEPGRADFEREGMGPFAPFGDAARAMHGYYEVPPRVLEDAEELALWVSRAVAVAAAAAERRRRVRPRARPRRPAATR